MIFIWKTPWWKIVPWILVFVTVDSFFLAATLQKFVNGGWFPISIATLLSSMMVTWHYGAKTLQLHARDQAPTDDDIAGTLAQKLAVRSPGTAIFFSDAHLLVTPEFGVWKMIKNFHVLPSRTVLLTIQTVHVPFVSPTTNGNTALHVKTLGNGMFNVTATFGYAQSFVDANVIATDILAELDRLEGNFEGEVQTRNEISQEQKSNETLFLVCTQQLSPSKTAVWYHRLRLSMFNVLAQNASTLSDFYHIPHEQLTEMGHTIVV